MPGRFDYKPLVKYPHLKPEDVLTWVFFQESHPNEYDTVDYDFPLGELPDHSTLAKDLDIAGVERLNQYKVDVIGYAFDHIDILELKGKATISAIGQILAYKDLYDREQKPKLATRAVLVARTATPDLDRLCTVHGVHLIIV